MFLHPPTRLSRSRSSQRRSRTARHRYLEALEARTLMSATISISGTSPTDFRGNSGVYDAADNLWVANNNASNGGEIDKVTFDTDGNPVLNPVININDSAPSHLTQSGGLFYFIDDNNPDAISRVDPNNPTAPVVTFPVNSTYLGNNAVPASLTASADGAIWFLPFATFVPPDASGQPHRNIVIGRLDPTTSTVSYFLINSANSSVADSQAVSISPFSTNGVYIGFQGNDDFNTVSNTYVQGANHIGTAVFSGGNISATVYSLSGTNSDDISANTNDYLTGVATAADGSLWFTLGALSSANTTRTVQAADRIVHGTLGAGVVAETTYIVPGASSTSPENLGFAAFDGSSHLWFIEQQSNTLGFLDTANLTSVSDRFVTDAFPDGPDGPTTAPTSLFVDTNAGGSNAWVTSESDGFSLLQAQVTTVSSDGTPLTITGSSFNALILRFALSTVTFTDDASSTVSWFTATINWGDNTTSTGIIVADPSTPGRYIVLGLHQYKKNGTYHITETINTNEVGDVIASNVATGVVTVRLL